MISRVTPDVGSGRIMTTDGGPHPPELWAQVTVDSICSLGPNLDPLQHTAALRMKADMIDLIAPLFKQLLDQERNELSGDPNRMASGVDPAPGVDTGFDALMKASKGSRWESLFTESMNEMPIKQILAQNIGSMLFGEHSWEAVRNPNTDAAISFRETYYPFAPVEQTDEIIARAREESMRNEPGGGR